MRKVILVVLIMTLVSVAWGTTNNDLVDGIAYLIDREEWHPKREDREWATEMARMVDKAAATYQLDPWLLAACGNVESHFRPEVVTSKVKGKAGERGMLQCGKDCARKCPHFMDTEGAVMCGARWLRQAIDDCDGNEWQGLVMYASGKYCDPPKGSKSTENGLTFRQKANRRAKLRDRLKDKFLNK